jgi:hypothetical protein
MNEFIIEEVELQLIALLTSALDGDEWLASPSSTVLSLGRGPRAGLCAVSNRGTVCYLPYRESKPGRPARSLITIMT